MGGGQNDFHGSHWFTRDGYNHQETSSSLGSDLSAMSFYWVKCASDLCAPCFWMCFGILTYSYIFRSNNLRAPHCWYRIRT